MLRSTWATWSKRFPTLVELWSIRHRSRAGAPQARFVEKLRGRCYLDGAVTILLQGFVASISCTRSETTPPTRAWREGMVRWLYSFIKAQETPSADLRSLPENPVVRCASTSAHRSVTRNPAAKHLRCRRCRSGGWKDFERRQTTTGLVIHCSARGTAIDSTSCTTRCRTHWGYLERKQSPVIFLCDCALARRRAAADALSTPQSLRVDGGQGSDGHIAPRRPSTPRLPELGDPCGDLVVELALAHAKRRR